MKNANSIVRATDASSAELGLFSSALLLLRTCSAAGSEVIEDLVRRCGRDLPIFDALARRCISHTGAADILDDIVEGVGEYLVDGITDVVCTAMEAELLDRLVQHFPDHRFAVVSHDPTADKKRMAGNYEGNVKFIESHNIDANASPVASVLLVPVFDAGTGTYLTTYPNALRILGSDTATKFAEIIAVDLLGSQFHYRPSGMVRVSAQQFTQIVHVPVMGTLIGKYKGVTA